MSAASTAYVARAPLSSMAQAVRSCLMFAVQTDGMDITTVEGLSDGDTAEPVAGVIPQASCLAMRLLHAPAS